MPPVEFCLGVSPIQALKARPERKTPGSGTAATSAVAVKGPTPGIAASRWESAFDLCQTRMRRSARAI